ncbi:MAG: motility protein A [Elusimicrobia bacterium]|nr:motility protein A [Elusimicrobiota bacterium]MBD3412354.1 motility protein A [Elusimicrobiota bacterium]
MDITTIIGTIVGFVLILAGIAWGAEGFNPARLGNFFNFQSFLITFGGTFCAILINYPIKQVFGTVKIVRKVFADPGEDTSKLITTFVTLAQKSKKEGFLTLEADVKKLDNDFMKRGVQLVIDGQDAEFIRNTLETELTFISERHRVGQEIFSVASTYFPAFGMIGTIIGLILMLANLQDQSQIASGMAVALLTTFYGLVFGFLMCMPIAGKLKRRSEEELLIKEIVIRGVLLLQSGITPTLLEANLQAYLEPGARRLAAAVERARSST